MSRISEYEETVWQAKGKQTQLSGGGGGGQKESDVPYHTTQEEEGNVKWETRHGLKSTWMSMV